MDTNTTDTAAPAADATQATQPIVSATIAKVDIGNGQSIVVDKSSDGTISKAVVAGADSVAPSDAAAREPTAEAIKNRAEVLLMHLDVAEVHTEASTWLESAREAIRCAMKYVEGHFAALEAKIDGDAKTVEGALDKPATSTDTAAAMAATAATAG